GDQGPGQRDRLPRAEGAGRRRRREPGRSRSGLDGRHAADRVFVRFERSSANPDRDGDSAMTGFFADLWADLREKRLWPAAVALLAAIVAVAVVLFKPASDAAPPNVAAPHTSKGPTLPVVHVDGGPLLGSHLEGISPDHKNAQFFLVGPGYDAQGEGTCIGAKTSQFVTMSLSESGNEENFSSIDGSKSYDLKLLKIRRENLGSGSQPTTPTTPSSSK